MIDVGPIEIEAFYDLPDVTYQGIHLFEESGLEVMSALEQLNGGGALESVGIVIFENLGITSGRLDQIRSRAALSYCVQGRVMKRPEA